MENLIPEQEDNRLVGQIHIPINEQAQSSYKRYFSIEEALEHSPIVNVWSDIYLDFKHIEQDTSFNNMEKSDTKYIVKNTELNTEELEEAKKIFTEDNWNLTLVESIYGLVEFIKRIYNEFSTTSKIAPADEFELIRTLFTEDKCPLDIITSENNKHLFESLIDNPMNDKLSPNTILFGSIIINKQLFRIKFHKDCNDDLLVGIFITDNDMFDAIIPIGRIIIQKKSIL